VLPEFAFALEFELLPVLLAALSRVGPALPLLSEVAALGFMPKK
jgi:hypothetical protein